MSNNNSKEITMDKITVEQLIQNQGIMMDLLQKQATEIELLKEMMTKSLHNDKALAQGMDIVQDGILSQNDFQKSLVLLLNELIDQGSTVLETVKTSSKEIQEHTSQNRLKLSQFVLKAIESVHKHLNSVESLTKGTEVEVEGKKLNFSYSDEAKEKMESNPRYVPNLEDIEFTFKHDPINDRDDLNRFHYDFFMNEGNYKEEDLKRKIFPTTVSLKKLVSLLFTGISMIKQDIYEAIDTTKIVTTQSIDKKLQEMEDRMYVQIGEGLMKQRDDLLANLDGMTSKKAEKVSSDVARMLRVNW